MNAPTDPVAEPTAERPIPLWLALAVMGAILIAGGGLIWKYLYRPAGPAGAVATIVPTPDNPRMAGGAPGPDPKVKADVLRAAGEGELPDGVHDSGNELLFKAGGAYMKVRGGGGGDGRSGQTAYSFGSYALPDVEWEHGYLSQGVRRIVSQDDFARELGVTEAQRKALADLPDPPATKWPQAERNRFVAMYERWAKAGGDARPRAGEELVAALRAYVEKKRPADQAAMGERIGKIRSILSAEQVKKINPVPWWEVK